MKTIEYTFTDLIPRTGWGQGPWDGEPDKIQWLDQATGLPCLAKRQHFGGHWCGYVGVPETHPLFGKHYDEADMEAHGGLTFADRCQGDAETGICHVTEIGDADPVWWFGFDCAHAGDLQPGMKAFYREQGFPELHLQFFRPDVYRTLDYVKAECAKLAKQLIAVA